MKIKAMTAAAVILAAFTVTSCASASKSQASSTPAVQKTAKPLDAKALLTKLKTGKVIHMKSCGCDPDPYEASVSVVAALTAISQGTARVADYPTLLTDLIEGYPPRFSSQGQVKASKAMLEAVQTLIEAGANVDGLGMCRYGGSAYVLNYTPLHSAVRMGDTALVKLLLDAGARPSKYTKVEDYEGEGDEDRYLTPLDYTNNPEMVALLKQYGAKKGNVMMNSTMMRMRADQLGEEF